jgi:nitrite reductase (NO-forming)
MNAHPKSFLAALVGLAFVGMVGSASAQDKAVMAKGQKVYNEYCKTCHQANGQGLGAVYPPLAKSDYLMNTKKEQIIKEIIKGKSGKIKVNGKEYNGVMAALPAKYTAEETAAVITYVYNSWGNKGPVVTAAEVKKADPKRK